jgi:Golgi SNAP receptor complex protein 1
MVMLASSTLGGAGELEKLSWEELGRLAKVCENDIDTKLLTLGRLCSTALRIHRYDGLRQMGDSPLRQAETLAEDVQSGLTRLGALVEALSSRIEGVQTHILQRHRDIYFEYTKEFRKAKVGLF